MNITYKQSQFELFPGSPGSNGETGRPRYLFANLTFSPENLIIVSIILVLVMVFCFSLGVERGRRLMRTQPLPAAEKIQASVVPVVIPPISAQPAVKNGRQIPTTFKATVTQVAELASIEQIKPVDLKTAASNKVLKEVETLVKDVYTIQVASFKQNSYAKREADVLKQKGFDIFVVPKGGHSIVCVGKFAERTDAKAYSNKIPKQYKDFVIRRL